MNIFWLTLVAAVVAATAESEANGELETRGGCCYDFPTYPMPRCNSLSGPAVSNLNSAASVHVVISVLTRFSSSQLVSFWLSSLLNTEMEKISASVWW